MAEAFICISDVDGQILVQAVWGENGDQFDKASPAHRMGAALVKHADSIAGRIPESEPLPTAITVARFADSMAAQERKAMESGDVEPMFGNAH